ncbi:MAG TPA: nuclear transport factor 2 family protein [Nevskiaceae bacterium]|nr:nuclear transport factor 2 family protein [Nevskiaceae bacterium]
MSRWLLAGAGLLLASAAVAATPATEVVDRFHQALERGDRAGAEAVLAPEVVIFETGFVTSLREDYLAEGFPRDAEFARQTERRVLRRESWQDGNVAWVLSTTLTEGRFGEDRLALEGAESVMLRRDGESWRIMHVHWSAHPRSPAP